MKFDISRHAHEEIVRREIPLNIVETVLNNPQQIVEEYGNKKAYQSIIDMGTGKDYLVRVIVNETLTRRRWSQFIEQARSANTGGSHENYL